MSKKPIQFEAHAKRGEELRVRNEDRKVRYIYEKEWDRATHTDYVANHPAIKKLLSTKKNNEIPHPTVPNVVITEVTPEYYEQTAHVICASREDNIFVKALGKDPYAAMPHYRRTIRKVLSWPGAFGLIALDKKQKKVLATQFYVDWLDMRKVYNASHQRDDPEARMLLYMTDKFEQNCQDPSLFANLKRGEMHYVFWGSTLPDQRGHNFTTTLYIFGIPECRKRGFTGAGGIAVHQSTYLRYKKVVEASKAFSYEEPFSACPPSVIGENSPIYKITSFPGLYAFCKFGLYSKQKPSSKL